jgi:hypothetical protein
MLINSVANNWDTPDRTAITGGANQDISTSVGAGEVGLLSVLILCTVDTHISRTSPASTSKFLLLANTYFEIPVADLKSFSIWGTGAGFMYLLEWRG